MANVFINEHTELSAICAETIAQGAAVSIGAGDGLIYLANSKVGGGLEIPCCGFADIAGAAGDMISIRTQGRMETDTTLNPGDPVYLAETDGAVTSTIPADAGDYIQVVGQAESASVFVINIYPRAVII